MIKISINRNQEKLVNSFKIEGHAYADEPGKDIVCASVSILTQTAVLSLYEIANIDISYEMLDGLLSCELPEHISDEQRDQANIIINTMLIGLKGIVQMYPEYVDILDKEV